MRLSLSSPIVTRLPRPDPGWEATAGIEELAEVARAADRLGYEHLTCSEHVVVPSSETPVRGGTYWDPLATFGYLAACTTTIRFMTYVLVLGYHHPLAIAKRYGTLDVVSGGRLILGIGVGTLREEFELLGAPFDERGPRADDALRALRASLSTPTPAYAGPYYRYEGVVVDPCAVQPRVPIWIGGRSRRSVRRAVELADGWAPFWLSPERVGTMLAGFDLPPGFEVVVANTRPFDAVGDPAGTEAGLVALQEVGVTVVNATVAHRSLANLIEQLEALREIGRALPG